MLKKNKTLTERNELLEEQVEHIREEVRDGVCVGSGAGDWGAEACAFSTPASPPFPGTALA